VISARSRSVSNAPVAVSSIRATMSITRTLLGMIPTASRALSVPLSAIFVPVAAKTMQIPPITVVRCRSSSAGNTKYPNDAASPLCNRSEHNGATRATHSVQRALLAKQVVQQRMATKHMQRTQHARYKIACRLTGKRMRSQTTHRQPYARMRTHMHVRTLLQQAGRTIQPAAMSGVQHTTGGVQHGMSSVQHATSSKQRAACNMPQAARSMQRAACNREPAAPHSQTQPHDPSGRSRRTSPSMSSRTSRARRHTARICGESQKRCGRLMCCYL
jgi:hypothetical protein